MGSKKQLVTRGMRSVATAVAARTPPTVGPAPWRRLAAREHVARARELADRDPAQALQLVDPVLNLAEAPEDSWELAFSLAASENDEGRILDRARDAVSSGHRSVPMLLAYRKLAAHRHEHEHVDCAAGALATCVPSSQDELDQVAGALRYSPFMHAERFLKTIHEHAGSLSGEKAREAVDELSLIEAYRVDPQRFRIMRDGVFQERERPLRVVGSALRRVKAWTELAEAVDQAMSDPDTVAGEPFPVWIMSKAATSAYISGYTAAAASLARHVLQARPKDAAAAALLPQVQDELNIARNGWTMPFQDSADPSYEPRPGAVLSVLGQSLPIRTGGYATRSHGILTSMADRGWDMRAVTRRGFPFDLWWKADDPRWPDAVDVVDGIEYHRLLDDGVRHYPRHPLADYVAAGADGIARVARDHGAGLIHASSLYDVGLAGAAAARQLGVPFVYEMRGLKQLLEAAQKPEFAGSDRDRFLDMIEMEAVREADALFVITAALGAELERMGADPDRITVVPNGVHVDRFTPRPRDAELERELGVVGKTVIGYVGGLVHYEGLELLLDAAAALGRERDDFQVVIVGDGAHQRALTRHAEQVGAEPHVTFTGRVPHEEVERYLSLVDIAPFPRMPLRVCELISPIKPFESMAMSKAVVVSDVAALTEVVTDGENGRVFTKGDADDLQQVLTDLLDAPEERARLGACAKDWVRRERDWSTITATVDAAYRSVLGLGDLST